MTPHVRQHAYREATKVQEELKKWLVRRVECIRGRMTLGAFEAPRPPDLRIRVFVL